MWQKFGICVNKGRWAQVHLQNMQAPGKDLGQIYSQPKAVHFQESWVLASCEGLNLTHQCFNPSVKVLIHYGTEAGPAICMAVPERPHISQKSREYMSTAWPVYLVQVESHNQSFFGSGIVSPPSNPDFGLLGPRFRDQHGQIQATRKPTSAYLPMIAVRFPFRIFRNLLAHIKNEKGCCATPQRHHSRLPILGNGKHRKHWDRAYCIHTGYRVLSVTRSQDKKTIPNMNLIGIIFSREEPGIYKQGAQVSCI